jgi:serine/threonine protein kinase
MCVLGAVFVENVVVQQLTDYIWTGGNSYDDKALESVARLFKALSLGLENLKTFYQELKIVKNPDLRRMFPCTRFYLDSLGQQVNFHYCERLSTTKAVFLAKRTFDNKQLIVKFVQRYNSTAHRLLASHDLAPLLHYSSLDDSNSKRLGALGMVVMDYVGESNAYQLYPNGRLPNAIYEGVEQAIRILHDASIVFGDLRLPNIVITKEHKLMLVDFDWCGIDGIDRYPPSLNDSSAIGWAEGVARNGVMRVEHDTFMLEAMRPPDHAMDWSS